MSSIPPAPEPDTSTERTITHSFPVKCCLTAKDVDTIHIPAPLPVNSGQDYLLNTKLNSIAITAIKIRLYIFNQNRILVVRYRWVRAILL